MHYNWNIKYGMEWQRGLEENIWQAVVRAQQESCFADLPPVGMLTFDYSAQQLTKDPNLIKTAELHPYGGQHQIKGIQEFMKINPAGKQYHENKGFHAHLYAFGDVRNKRMRDKYVQLLVSEHEKVQLFSTERSWMARFRMLRRFLLQSYADYPALLQALTDCRTKAARKKIQTEICEAWQNPNPPTYANTTINCRVCLSEQGIVDLIEELEKRWLALETLGQKKEKLKADKAKQAARKKKAKKKKSQSTQMNFLAMSLGKREKAMVKGTVQQKETGSKTKPLPGKHIERLFAKTNPEVVKQVLRMAINKEVEVKDMPKEAQKLMSILRGRIAFCLVAEVESLEAAVDCLPAHIKLETVKDEISKAVNTLKKYKWPSDAKMNAWFAGDEVIPPKEMAETREGSARCSPQHGQDDQDRPTMFR